MSEKPNIMIIMTDQQRADLRKSRGFAVDTMPFLDEWSCGGADFGKAYTSNPTCMPARVSMFTGRYSESHHVRTNHNVEDVLYTKDLLDVLKENGYQTAICGKNHSHHAYTDFDFHETNGHLGNEAEEKNTTKEEETFAEFLRNTNFLDSDVPAPGGVEVQHPYRNVTSALKFVDEVGAQQPFFAWVSMAEPHNPYQVPEPYFDMFPPDALPPVETDASVLASKGEKFQFMRAAWERVFGDKIDEKIARSRSNYLGMLRLIDDQVKRLIDGLAERKVLDNTIVIYLSDHGDFVGEYGLIRKGPDLPDVLTRIPMIWKGPGIEPQGLNSRVYVSIVDILPTICDVLNIETPLGCQGKSILPILEYKNIPECEFDCAYAESGFSGMFWNQNDALIPENEGATSKEWDRFDCLDTWTQAGQVRALWEDNYHMQFDMMGNGYLYDLIKDSHEIHNLWNDPDKTVVKEKLMEKLMAEMLKNTDVLPVPHNRYRTKVHPKGYWNQEYISPDMGVRKMEPIGNHKIDKQHL